ncbi:type IV secretion system DNA-binding domain-containing protein [Gemmiger sp. An50]|uniref:type IV secretory system conjugative DNA transfer family protein n=1 Tax=Gemmiger sp. An50 TaxID=1965639 RepID=UPI000B3960B5|nr:type IV secretion system DNA-binding domain-containing protein [Gemmiger sp. An50]OUN83774.1 hypothetical protein B5G03_14270 [Gemmiger sp. An50]
MLMRIEGNFTRTVPAPSAKGNPLVQLSGECLGCHELLEMDEQQLARGMLLAGASRTGKSQQQAKMIRQVRQQMTRRDVLVILDTKGDYAKKFFRLGDVILGTGGPFAPTAGWNIFRDCTAGCKTKTELSQRIGMIASRVFCRENLHVPFFTDAPRRVLEELLETLLRHSDLLPAGEVLDNHGLLAFLQRGDWGRFLLLCSAPQEMRGYIGDGKFMNPTEHSVLAELLINVTMALCGVWGGHGTFSMVDFETNRSGRTMFLQYDLRDGGAADNVYQLLIDLLLISFMNGHNADGRLYLFLDEIHLLGKSPEMLCRTLNYGPGIGLGCVCVGSQSLAQLEGLCGKVGMETLLAGLQTRVLFRMEDDLSRQFVKEQCGKIRAMQYQFVPGISYSGSAGQFEDAVTDEELLSMDVGQAIVKSPGHPAFFFRFDE